MPGLKPRKWSDLRVVIGSIMLAGICCGFGLLSMQPGLFEDRTTRLRAAHDRGDWTGAARLAREVLKVDAKDRGALRHLARSMVRIGHDDAAMGIYAHRLDGEALEAEDYLLWGLAQKRRGQDELALAYWNRAIEADAVSARLLDELSQLFYEQGSRFGNSEYLKRHPFDQAARAAERVSREAGWELRGEMTLGLIRNASNDLNGAADAFRHVLLRDATVAGKTQDPQVLRKLLARLFLRVGSPAEARPHLQAILEAQPDREASWLMSRVFLQEGRMADADVALKQAGTYRSENPLAEEPSPFVGEARCASCHQGIARGSMASRHTHTYYRGEQVRSLPRPDRPLADPTEPNATHAVRQVDGAVIEETRVGGEVMRSVVEYAFGTSDRYLTMVLRDSSGRSRNMRLSYYCTAEGRGWERTSLDDNEPRVAEDFQGAAISVRAGVVRCLYCHTTFARAGLERVGPETADSAIGCERCHGPGGHHVAAIAAGFSDRAIVNPGFASPMEVTEKQCNDCHILDRNYVNGDREDQAWVRTQGAGWAWSRCNTVSGGRFGCVTCHDPHKGARATSTAEYEAKCLGCHAGAGDSSRGRVVATARDRLGEEGPTDTVCPVNASKGCLGCHMPAVRMERLHMSLTDHYIRVSRSNVSSSSDQQRPHAAAREDVAGNAGGRD
jgi:predicted CXXCH cytochrome family protein